MLLPRHHTLLVILGGLVGGGCSKAVANSNHTLSSIHAIDSAVRTYQIKTGELPPADFGLRALLERPPSLPPDKPWAQILKEVPRDSWDRPIHYLTGDGFEHGFGLYSCGADGVSATIGNDPDDWNSWSEMRPDEPAWVRHQKPAILIGGLVIAAGAFLLGYRVAKKEMRQI